MDNTGRERERQAETERDRERLRLAERDRERMIMTSIIVVAMTNALSFLCGSTHLTAYVALIRRCFAGIFFNKNQDFFLNVSAHRKSLLTTTIR